MQTTEDAKRKEELEVLKAIESEKDISSSKGGKKKAAIKKKEYDIVIETDF